MNPSSQRLNAFGAYKQYVAIKLHFTSTSYDYFKFNGAVRLNESSFDARKDFYYFDKLATKYRSTELIDYLFSNFMETPDIWIGALFNPQCLTRFTEWQTRVQSFGYRFESDCKFIKSQCDESEISLETLLSDAKESTRILRWEKQGKITPESICGLDRIFEFLPVMSRLNPTNPYIERRTKSLRKYSPHLWTRVSTPLSKISKIVEDTFNLH